MQSIQGMLSPDTDVTYTHRHTIIICQRNPEESIELTQEEMHNLICFYKDGIDADRGI